MGPLAYHVRWDQRDQRGRRSTHAAAISCSRKKRTAANDPGPVRTLEPPDPYGETRARPGATLSVPTVTKLLDVMENDQLTVQRALSGDQAAMRSLWARHAPHIDVVVRRLVGQDADLAADIAQEVWIQIFRALPSFRGDAQFGTWAHRIAVNRTLNALRRTRRLAAIEVEVEDDTASVEPDVERSFLAASIEEAAAKLSPGARTVFLLHDVEGYTHEEIAAELGITSGGSKSQLFKARAKLRRLLAHLVDAPARAPGRPTPVTNSVTSAPTAEHAAPLC
ncbi:MAG: polymerase ECF-type sigma factor [Gemmatimonadetes bacterium]|nr:polymerase ECF-type sigma factor [Gemmatimonadota bacterium]